MLKIGRLRYYMQRIPKASNKIKKKQRSFKIKISVFSNEKMRITGQREMEF